MADTFSITETGLQGIETAMEVVSNNLANTQTDGYKSESVDFGTLFGQFVAGNSIGGGSQVVGVTQDFSSGATTQVNSQTDMSIQGNGFFVLQDPSGQQTYTQNGTVTESANGTLVGFNGDSLLGYGVSASGTANGILAPIVIPSGLQAPSASTTATLSGNLNSSSPIIAGAINPTDPTTYNTAVSVQVYDSLGNAHVLTFYFQNAGAGVAPAAENWNWTATLDGSAVGLANNSGTVGFDANGNIVSGAIPGSALTATVAGASSLSLNLDFSNMSQFASGAAVSGTADGNAAGQPEGIQIDSNGFVSVAYSNGTTTKVAQVALATFIAQQGLELSTGGTYIQTNSSGSPTISAPNSGSAGGILPNTLEESNVDTTNQLVSLVILQRAYQADAKALQTQDSILGTLDGIVTQ